MSSTVQSDHRLRVGEGDETRTPHENGTYQYREIVEMENYQSNNDNRRKKKLWTDQILKCNSIAISVHKTQQHPIHLLLTFEQFQVDRNV